MPEEAIIEIFKMIKWIGIISGIGVWLIILAICFFKYFIEEEEK